MSPRKIVVDDGTRQMMARAGMEMLQVGIDIQQKQKRPKMLTWTQQKKMPNSEKVGPK